MSLMTLAPGVQKSPILAVLALTLLAVSLWVAWAVHHDSTKTHQTNRSPSSVMDDETDGSNLRDAWVI